MISTFLWIPAHDCPHKRNRNVEEVVAHDTHLKDQDALDDEERQLLKGTSASALMWSEKEQRKNGAEKISRGPRPPQMLAAFETSPLASFPRPAFQLHKTGNYSTRSLRLEQFPVLCICSQSCKNLTHHRTCLPEKNSAATTAHCSRGLSPMACSSAAWQCARMATVWACMVSSSVGLGCKFCVFFRPSAQICLC